MRQVRQSPRWRSSYSKARGNSAETDLKARRNLDDRHAEVNPRGPDARQAQAPGVLRSSRVNDDDPTLIEKKEMAPM